MKVDTAIRDGVIGNGSMVWISEFGTFGIGKKVSRKTVPTRAVLEDGVLIKISERTGMPLKGGSISIRWSNREVFLTKEECVAHYNGLIQSAIQNAQDFTAKYVERLSKNLIGEEE